MHNNPWVHEKWPQVLNLFILIRYDEFFKNDLSALHQKRKFLNFLELSRNQEDSAFSWRDVSIPGLSEYIILDGDQWVNWKERGFSKTLDILMVTNWK